jgi:excisionase family DNA binding protein
LDRLQPSDSEDPRIRVIRLQRERKLRRARFERSRAKRRAALNNGDAPFLSPREYSELTGLSIATVYRRLYDGKLKHRKDGRRTLIYRDQLGSGS